VASSIERPYLIASFDAFDPYSIAILSA